MIFSNTRKQVRSYGLQAMVLLFTVAFPLGAAHAEDVEAKLDAYLQEVQTKLEAAVAAGEITEEKTCHSEELTGFR